jgi:hypothetical protein
MKTCFSVSLRTCSQIHRQRYCFFITLTIGFEEYFGELKTVKYLLLSNWTIGQLDNWTFVILYLDMGEGEFWTNTIF